MLLFKLINLFLFLKDFYFFRCLTEYVVFSEKLHFSLIVVCLCVNVTGGEYYVCTCCMWSSDNNLRDLFFSFYHVCSGDQTKVVRLGSEQVSLPLEPSHQSSVHCFFLQLILFILCTYEGVRAVVLTLGTQWNSVEFTVIGYRFLQVTT